MVWREVFGEVFRGRRAFLRDGDDLPVAQDGAARQVVRGGEALARFHEDLCDGFVVVAQLWCALQAVPVPSVARLLLACKLCRAFFRPPGEAAEALQVGNEQRVEAGEQADVIGGVVQLCRIKRTGKPVAAGLAFVRGDAEVVLNQRGVADGEVGRAEGKAGLCVADGGGQGAAAKLHQFEVLRGGVHDERRGMVQDGRPGDVAFQRVVELRGAARLAGLYQGEFGNVAAFAHKFAVVAEDARGVVSGVCRGVLPGGVDHRGKEWFLRQGSMFFAAGDSLF